MHAERTPRRPLSKAQKLRKLQLAVDHIAVVLEQSPGTECLDEALDLIHEAEYVIEDDD